MSNRANPTSAARLESAEKLLAAALHLWSESRERSGSKRLRAFVTVSRQPGAGGISFSHQLAERLNRDGVTDWAAWDSELVEKVSAEHGISKKIIESIANRQRNWLDEIVQSFVVSETPPSVSETNAYKKVVLTIRALAEAGHAIIVGRGGQFITQGLPGAIHLRLVAPMSHRLIHTAERDKVSLKEAAERIHELEKRRADFYRRYWPGRSNEPETFTMTLNTRELSIDEMVACVLPVVRYREMKEMDLAKAEDRATNRAVAVAAN